jgi:hypothetical protein
VIHAEKPGLFSFTRADPVLVAGYIIKPVFASANAGTSTATSSATASAVPGNSSNNNSSNSTKPSSLQPQQQQFVSCEMARNSVCIGSTVTAIMILDVNGRSQQTALQLCRQWKWQQSDVQ